MIASRILLLSCICGTGVAFGGVPDASHAPSAPSAPSAPRAEQIAPNDNAHRAGHLSHGVLTVALEARNGEWHPESSAGPTYAVAAFAEGRGALQNPGPLLRAPVGTEIRVTMHNALDKPMWVYGLGEGRGYSDSVQVAAGETREMHFRATTPGLSYYAARTTTAPVRDRRTEDSQLNGVIVIDPPGATPSDRIFAITQWYTIDTTTVSGLGPNSMLAFNGLGWPYTPRIDIEQGDTARWRFVNMTELEHPLHLHGVYFRVDAKGDGIADSIYAPDDRRMAVTELVLPGQTMSMSWSPLHSGNWIFHCHFASHITKREFFETDRLMPAQPVDWRAMQHDDGRMSHMAALVIGIRVHPRGAQPPVAPVSQEIRLLVRSHADVYGKHPGYGFVRGDSPMAATPDSFTVPGPTLELTRGKRVAITLVNQAFEPIAVHWHGIELESFPDGVPGWSGAGKTTMPFIMPGDSLTVRFTPPRAGTFMYHSHSNEMQEISSGLYGAIIVREPGAAVDSAERTLIFSDDGPVINFLGHGPPVLLNGKVEPDTIEIPSGRATKLRLINIRTETSLDLTLEQNGVPVSWRATAKDGATLPAHQARNEPAFLHSAPGEAFDFEIAPDKPGTMVLRYVGSPGDTTTTQRAIVKVQ